MKTPKLVAIVFNLKGGSVFCEQDQEYDEPETIEAIAGEIERFGVKTVNLKNNNLIKISLLCQTN